MINLNDKSEIAFFKAVFVSSPTLGLMTLVVSDSEEKLMDYVFSEKSQNLGDLENEIDMKNVNDCKSKGLVLRAVVYGQDWDRTVQDSFVTVADKYTMKQYLSTMFPYCFVLLAGGQGILMYGDDKQSQSLVGTLEDRVVSNFRAMVG